MRTKIGDMLLRLRLEKGQILKDMADILHVSSAFLSAVENGKKTFPHSWYQILQEKYSLNENEMDGMKQAAMESQKSISLNLNNASETNKQLAVSFARQFDEIDEDTSQEILKILNEMKMRR